jgi:hypothetical protein
MVPTPEMISRAYIMEMLVRHGYPVLLCGESGAGKTLEGLHFVYYGLDQVYPFYGVERNKREKKKRKKKEEKKGKERKRGKNKGRKNEGMNFSFLCSIFCFLPFVDMYHFQSLYHIPPRQISSWKDSKPTWTSARAASKGQR